MNLNWFMIILTLLRNFFIVKRIDSATVWYDTLKKLNIFFKKQCVLFRRLFFDNLLSDWTTVFTSRSLITHFIKVKIKYEINQYLSFHLKFRKRLKWCALYSQKTLHLCSNEVCITDEKLRKCRNMNDPLHNMIKWAL